MKGIKKEQGIIWFLLISITLWLVVGILYITNNTYALPTITHDDPPKEKYAER